MPKVETGFCTMTYFAFVNSRKRFYWFLVPDDMSAEAAFDTQKHHGPFASEAECAADQRAKLIPPSENGHVR
jgi:hypothetical protein